MGLKTIPKHKLTKRYLKKYADEQIAKYLSTEPVDEKLAEQHISKAYEVAELKKPMSFVWFDSPKKFSKAEIVRASVGDSVWDSVSGSVGNSVGNSVWASVWNSVGDSVLASVRASVGDSVWDSVRASVLASVETSVGNSVRASVLASVETSVGNSVWASVRAWYDASYNAQLNFFNDNLEKNNFEHMCLFTEMVNGYLLTEDTVYICRKPIFLTRDQQGRLHNETRMAIEWKDGTGFYYLHGVEFTKEVWQKIVSQEFTMKDLTEITDVDKRAVAIQMLKPETLLKQIDAKLTHTGIKGTKLYEVERFAEKVLGDSWNLSNLESTTEYCMLMSCPSTGRQFIEWVEPKVGKLGDADLCQANAWGIKKSDYLAIGVEA